MVETIEPCVIEEDLIRSCVKISGPIEAKEDKTKQIALREVDTLICSFRNILKIDNLMGLENLVKLQLDNNVISKIQNLEHLTNLQWLDLSFNNISKIEGLDTLHKLKDLSLFNNNIETIENLGSLSQLSILSLGNNNISKIENVLYLRRFRHLRLINLAGNPICNDTEYRPYVISHVKNLKYLDYRMVSEQAVNAAKEHYQDELLEIEENETKAEMEERDALTRAEKAALMSRANLEGVTTLFDDMLKEDPEYNTLKKVPDLLAPLADFHTKWQSATDEFVQQVLDQHEKKVGERAEWDAVVKEYTGEKDEQARHLILEFKRIKKRTFRELRDDPSNAETKTAPLRQSNLELKDKLMDLELDIVEALEQLYKDFDNNYIALVEQNKINYNTYFTQLRDLENAWFEAVTGQAMQHLEQYQAGELEDLESDTRTLLQDKEMLLNSIQSSHDAHTSKIDSLEDKLVTNEVKNSQDMMMKIEEWIRQQNRERINEISNLCERQKTEVEEAIAIDDSLL